MPYDKENKGRKEMCQVMCRYVDVQSHKLYATHRNVKLSSNILDKKKASLVVIGLMIISLQYMKWQSNININIQHDEEYQECDNGGYKETCES